MNITCIHGASGALHTLPVQAIYEADAIHLQLFLKDLRRWQTIVHNELAMRAYIQVLQEGRCEHGVPVDDVCSECDVAL